MGAVGGKERQQQRRRILARCNDGFRYCVLCVREGEVRDVSASVTSSGAAGVRSATRGSWVATRQRPGEQVMAGGEKRVDDLRVVKLGQVRLKKKKGLGGLRKNET